MDLNQLSPEEIVDLAYALEDEMNKEASEQGDIDLNELSADEIIDLGYALQEEYYGDDLEKEAGLDLNELSVDEFIEVAAHLENEMEKEAKMKDMAGAAGRYMKDVFKAGRFRRAAKGRRAALAEGEKGHARANMLGMVRGAAETGAAYGTPVAGAAYAMKRRRRKSRR